MRSRCAHMHGTIARRQLKNILQRTPEVNSPNHESPVMTQTLARQEQNAKPSPLRLAEFCNRKSTSHAQLKTAPAVEPVPARTTPKNGCLEIAASAQNPREEFCALVLRHKGSPLALLRTAARRASQPPHPRWYGCRSSEMDTAGMIVISALISRTLFRHFVCGPSATPKGWRTLHWAGGKNPQGVGVVIVHQ